MFFLLPYLWCGIYGLWAAKNIYGMGSSGAQTLCYGLWDDYGKNDYGAALNTTMMKERMFFSVGGNCAVTIVQFHEKSRPQQFTFLKKQAAFRVVVACGPLIWQKCKLMVNRIKLTA